MIGAEFIVTQQDTSSDYAIFSPWFRRQADNAIFTYYQIQKLLGTDKLRVEIFHKNEEELGPGTLIADADDFVEQAPTGSGIYWTSPAVMGLKELVRYRVWSKRTTGPALGTWFRILEPTWFNTAHQE